MNSLQGRSPPGDTPACHDESRSREPTFSGSPCTTFNDQKVIDIPDLEDEIVVSVEIPRGSRNKYECDPELDAIVLDRRLFTSTVYPADYGFVDGALAGDGDALDALVFVGDPTFPGCRIRVRTVGVFRMVDEKGQDDKLLCVPAERPSLV
jgi:inorganic pyrophosphatase